MNEIADLETKRKDMDEWIKWMSQGIEKTNEYTM
jgi:hypothetical protein